MARTERGIKRDLSLMFTEITPPHGWKQDSDFHYLRLTLPGFEANDITIHMDKYGHLVVRGTRQVSEHKYISFEETFDVPNNGKLDDACGMFENDQIYVVAIPKVKDQHGITMPNENINKHKPLDKKESGSIHEYNNNEEKQEVARRGSSKDYLKDIRGDKYKNKKTAFVIALLIAILVITVVLIVLLLRRR